MAGRNQKNGHSSDDEMEAINDAGFDSDEDGGLHINDEIYIPPPPRKHSELDVHGPRLMIDKIVNENFKSYAGKVSIGPFDECFSAVIGPNGSGKSNVIDSMLFVFGYRATKIRLKKISELIHNSSHHKDIRSCTVSIHFRRIIDKGGGIFEKVEDGGVVISRTAFRDSSSFYELNGRKVQLKEIAKLLRSEGIDLDHNRFLILQGEVEQIAMMKPKGQSENDTGMLEFLEDIIGTTRYKVPLEKLSENVEALTEHRMEKLNRLRHVEAEKDALQEPMQDAIQYLKIENTITKLRYELYHCKKSATATKIVEHQAEKEELDTDYAKLKDEMKKVREEIAITTAESTEKCKKWDMLQAEKDKKTSKFDEIRRQDEALHAELVETNKRRKANMASLKTEKTTLEGLSAVPIKNVKKIEELEEFTNENQAHREKEEEALKTLMNTLREKTEPLLEERKEFETKLISLRKNVDEAKATCDLAESELEIYTSVEQTEKRKLEGLRENLQTTSETLQQCRNQLATLQTKIPATTKSLKEAQRELTDVKNREVEVSARLRDMRVRFEEKRSAMNASKSRNRVIDALMAEKRAGRIPGLFGRLGDLGAVDAKYDVAVSTACGPLDNVVVDTLQTAQACILFLRQNDIGRTTFIPLEKQARYLPQCNQKITTPEKVPRLFDLIKVEDERVLPAFYYALRNTLVATDLNQATRIAYGAQRYRVVTLKGELIEISGTMSGGGKTVLKGRMGQSVVRTEPSAADVEKLQSDLDSVYEECNSLRLRQQPLEDQVYTLTTALQDMTTDRDKCEIEVKALSIQEPSLQNQIKVQEKRAAAAVSNPERVQSLEKAVDLARVNYAKVKDSSKETENTVERLSQKIEELSGGRVKAQQKKIADIAKTIGKAEAEIRSLQVAIKTAERNAKKTEQRIETLETDIHNCENKLREMQKEKMQFEELAKTIMNELDELSTALVERDEIQTSFKEKLAALTKRESKMKAVKIDLDQKIQETGTKLKEVEALITDYGRKIAGLNLHNIPGETSEKLEPLTDEQVSELNSGNISASLQRAMQRLPEQIPNMQIIKDYHAKEAAYLQRAAELDEITTERNKLRDVYDMARHRRSEEFLAGFIIITGKLKQMYQMITLDGDAELELVDSMDPFSEGIVFTVRPPKKSWKNISNLSGGEKTLSSLALVFALHHYKPSPVYFMDEIDAALDFKNISIVGNYIKDRAKNSQFIVISLRDNMFELANTLVGIYKTYDATKSVTINMERYAEKHDGPPVVQKVSTVKNRYCSQSTKSAKESVASRLGRNDGQNPVTCPAVIAGTASSTSEANHSFGLSDVILPSTPAKTPSGRKSTSSDVVEGTPSGRKSALSDVVDGTPEARPSRKRRRL